MHLLFVTNDAYVPHVATTLCSIFENNMDMDFCVHVMATNISDDNLRKLQQFVKGYHHELDVKVINPDELEIDLSICGKWGIFPSLKLYAVDLYPEVDRMLYVDADMICLGSLKEIDDLDMSNWYVAASPDEEGSARHKARLSMPFDAFYGCAGLMYFNLDNWRKHNVRQACFTYFNDPKSRDIIQWGEQDVINKVCIERIYPLNLKFNMFSHYWLHHGQAVPKRYLEQWEANKKHPVIIHYIDSVKPWFKDNAFPYKKYYWHYHALTPWKGQTYGYSNEYQGKKDSFKKTIKNILHKLGVKKYDYCYDC